MPNGRGYAIKLLRLQNEMIQTFDRYQRGNKQTVEVRHAAPIALLTAAMAFDAPDSGYQVWAWIVFSVVLSIPLWFVVGAAAGWALYLEGWRRMSLVLAATPLGAAAVGWLLLQFVQ